ncbi:GcvT family protein, partial [Geminicoccus flavidas]|uniref:GcvT family protein n=1 Tax=Geminicoccus flavidas TaxID=2506407 RepID=UPI00190F4A2C
DYGIELIPEDIERIEPELALGFARYPALSTTGIRRWVNGAFTFTPDGNPLIGPVPGLRNYWCACGVMAGFSQGGGVGLALAQWLVDGEPGADVFGMDIARYGRFAANRNYLKATTAQFYARRFLLTYPNEQLPAGRPLRTPPAYDRMCRDGAQWGVSWGLEVPLYFAPAGQPFVETPTLERSNAFPLVAAECGAAREAVGLLDSSAFARYAVTGPGAKAFLDRLLACRLPKKGQVRLAPMLSRSGRLIGDLTVLAWEDDSWWLMGSYYLRAWHMRWMAEHLPPSGVTLADISDQVTGLALMGPNARALLARLTEADLASPAFPFLHCREMDVGLARARVARLSVSGELGYEINVAASEQPSLYAALLEAGRDLGLKQVGYRALDSLRIEKSFGIWSREFTWTSTPKMSGLDRFVAFDKGDFIGREAALAERDGPPVPRLLATLEIDAVNADASGFEPVWLDGRLVGQVTSGAFGHCCGKSLALTYLDSALVTEGQPLEVDVVGIRRQARVIPPSPVDPPGERMRA